MLKQFSQVELLMCSILRGQDFRWPTTADPETEKLFLLRSDHHGVQSLLYHAIHGRPEWSAWPTEARQDLEAASKAGTAQEMLRSHYLKKLLDGFSACQIRCILLKGEALARTHYATPGTRSRADSDVFIDLVDIEAARRVVREAGFSIVSPVYKSHQFTVRRTLDGADVVEFDLHWRILNNPRYARVLTFEQAFERSLPTPGLEHVRVLHPVDALTHACMHRVASDTHDRDRLIWIYDIHLLVASLSESRLRELAQDAVERDVQQACLDGIARVMDLFHTRVSGEVLEILRAPEPRRTWSRRFAESNLGLLVDDWRFLPNRRARLGLLQELLLPSTEALLLKYHKTSRYWLPYLYLRQVVGGVTERLLLR